MRIISKMLALAIILFFSSCKKETEQPNKIEVIISTVAGTGVDGTLDGPINVAKFGLISDVAIDLSGNIYVSEINKIRKISPDGIVTTLAGTGYSGYRDGPGNIAEFGVIYSLAVDNLGNIYAPDYHSQAIRKISPAGVVSTLAGGAKSTRYSWMSGYKDGFGPDAEFAFPSDITIDPQGNLIVTERSNARIRKVTPDGWVSTIAGTGAFGYSDGPALTATFTSLGRITCDKAGNLFFIDQGKVRKLDTNGNVSTIAGSDTYGYKNGIGATALFDNPQGICVDKDGNLYIGDAINKVIRKITPSGEVSLLAGGPNEFGFIDGPALSARFRCPKGLEIDVKGNIYVAGFQDHAVRKITFK